MAVLEQCIGSGLMLATTMRSSQTAYKKNGETQHEFNLPEERRTGL